ncbi:uncharacterized protein EV422DRAFT_140883 [Fimicolochytrium jonesii]|uniref:uncharacterized protein n=1 Tax=Fimicolochytrium jonesii TaxID=1396493 RepID=UPI0022FE80AA|nr:uncharacterized protein EV422DRAFT_140883 [Fimicolochytrium jonesii]KAI8825788.1 hypothetical protein EV422DRAFT_140883 [Fimicolochytrium jonesii]
MHKRLPFQQQQDDSRVTEGDLLDEQQQEDVIEQLRSQNDAAQGQYDSVAKYLGIPALIMLLVSVLTSKDTTTTLSYIIALGSTIASQYLLLQSRLRPSIGVTLIPLPIALIAIWSSNKPIVTILYLPISLWINAVPLLVVGAQLYVRKAGRDIGQLIEQMDNVRYNYKGA